MQLTKTPILSLFSTLLLLHTTPSVAQVNFAPVHAFSAGSLSTSTPGRFCDFTNGAFAQFQGDGNIVVYNAESAPLWNSAAHNGKLIPGAPAQQCPASGPCLFVFQGDGNFVAYYDGAPLWNAGTGGRGEWLVCQQSAPYLYIVDGAGNQIWSTNS